MSRISTSSSTYKTAALERDSQYIYNMSSEERLFEAVNKYFVEGDEDDDFIDDEINSSVKLADVSGEEREAQIMQIVNATDDITFDEMVGCDDIRDIDNEILFELASYEELESMGFDLTLEASRTMTALNKKIDARQKYRSCMKAARKCVINKDFKGAAKQLKIAKSAVNKSIAEIKKTKSDSFTEELLDTLLGIILKSVIDSFKSTLSFLTVFGLSYTILSVGKIDLKNRTPEDKALWRMMGVNPASVDSNALAHISSGIQNIYKFAKDVVGIINTYNDMRKDGNVTVSLFNTYVNRAITDLNLLGKRIDAINVILMKMEAVKVKSKKESKKENKKNDKHIGLTESENIHDFDEPFILNY